MSFLRKLFDRFNQKIGSMNSKFYVTMLRKKGVFVGENTVFFGHKGVDITRPSLVSIGNNCVITSGVQILTHGYDWSVLRNLYGEMLSSSGRVIIEDNVFIGIGAIILKGVRIGKNTIIGAGSIVTHNIPPNSVAAGNPCEVIMNIDEYYNRRKSKYIEEAKIYAYEIYRRRGEVPNIEDFWEEFPIFLDRQGSWGKLPVKFQLGSAYNNFLNSKPIYATFNDFLIDAGIPANKIPKNKERK
jgi:acetyltransferase-like isoleucine patch superfamily enzyme